MIIFWCRSSNITKSFPLRRAQQFHICCRCCSRCRRRGRGRGHSSRTTAITFRTVVSLNIYFLAKFAFIQIHTSLYTAYKIIHGHIYIFSYTLIALQKPKEQPSFKENVLILKSTLTTMIVILNTILNNKHRPTLSFHSHLHS